MHKSGHNSHARCVSLLVIMTLAYTLSYAMIGIISIIERTTSIGRRKKACFKVFDSENVYTKKKKRSSSLFDCHFLRVKVNSKNAKQHLLRLFHRFIYHNKYFSYSARVFKDSKHTHILCTLSLYVPMPMFIKSYRYQ